MAIDEVFACAAQYNLSSHRDLRVLFEADRGFLLVAVVEYDGDACFRHAGLAALVDEVLE